MNNYIQKKADNLNKKESTELTKNLTSILQKIKNQSKAFLVDTSGSMGEYVKDGTKIEIVNGLLDSLAETLQSTRVFKFSDNCVELKVNERKLRPEGGTAMHRAFEVMKESGVKEVTLLTDGQPDLEDAALAATRGLKIDIVYIGPQPPPAFLNKLAAVTGGMFQSQDMLKEHSSKLLTEKIKGLLTQGK